MLSRHILQHLSPRRTLQSPGSSTVRAHNVIAAVAFAAARALSTTRTLMPSMALALATAAPAWLALDIAALVMVATLRTLFSYLSPLPFHALSASACGAVRARPRHCSAASRASAMTLVCIRHAATITKPRVPGLVVALSRYILRIRALLHCFAVRHVWHVYLNLR